MPRRFRPPMKGEVATPPPDVIHRVVNAYNARALCGLEASKPGHAIVLDGGRVTCKACRKKMERR